MNHQLYAQSLSMFGYYNHFARLVGSHAVATSCGPLHKMGSN